MNTLHVEVNDDMDYSSFYASASSVDVVGIACRGFIKCICPDYLEDDFDSVSSAKRIARLKQVRNSPAIQSITNGSCKIVVQMCNPYCTFTWQRIAEENRNPDGRLNIIRSIRAVNRLFLDLNSSKTKPISGSLEFKLLATSPGVGYTRFSNIDGSVNPHLHVVNFLLLGKLGSDCPRLIFCDNGKVSEALRGHVECAYSNGDRLFKWDSNGLSFDDHGYLSRAQYDAFVCYNDKDKKRVGRVVNMLSEHGILPWQDKIALEPGNDWRDKINTAIQKARCALLFIGDKGFGPYQQCELFQIVELATHNKIHIIPVIIGSSKGSKRIPEVFGNRQWIDLRVKDTSAAVDALARAIRNINMLNNL